MLNYFSTIAALLLKSKIEKIDPTTALRKLITHFEAYYSLTHTLKGVTRHVVGHYYASQDLYRTTQKHLVTQQHRYNSISRSTLIQQIVMGKETTRMLCEHARPHSEKLADFIKKKKLETGMYIHPVIKRSLEKKNEENRKSLPRRASYTSGDLSYEFNEPSFVLSADTSTKLSINRSGTICAQDYYPSFLMADESRYEVSTTRYKSDLHENNLTEPQTQSRPPRDLSAVGLRQSMRSIYNDDVERVHPEKEVELKLSERLRSIPRYARKRFSKSNPRGTKYAY